MNLIKKILGVVAIILAFFAEWNLFTMINEGKFGKTAEEIFISQLTLIPVSLIVVLGGLGLFGYYAIMGEYGEQFKKEL
jgi:hypothetical protein